MPYTSPQDLELMLQPTKLDRAIASVFPSWGAKRVRSRRQYAYEAAVNTRLRSTSQRLTGPEDYQAFPDRIQLIKQVRDLENNFGLFQGIMDKLAMYAFDGLKYQARTGDKKLDDTYEEYLTDCFARCDLSCRWNLVTMVQIAFLSRLRDGDYGLKWQRNGAGELRLCGIEGDRLGGIYAASAEENYFQGLTVDKTTGEPLSWRVFQRTKADAYINPVEIPAMDIIHVFDPRRYDQYRGVTPFAPVINEARDLKELMEALRIGTKFENYHAAVDYTASGLPLGDAADFITQGTETKANGNPIQETEIKYGVIQAAPIGSKREFLKSERPAGTLQTYMESLIRLLGTALNLPYGFLYNLSSLGGPAARMDSAQAQRVIMHHQGAFKAQVLDRVKDTYLMEGFATGAIRYTPKWKSGAWQFPPWPTIDVGRESNAGVNEWRAGLRSKSAWFAESGEDAEEQEKIMDDEARRTLTRAEALSKEFDIPIELALTMLETRTQQGFYIANGQPKAEPEEPETPTPAPAEMKPLSVAAANTEINASAKIAGKLATLDRVREASKALNAAREWRASRKDPLAWLNEKATDEN